MSEKEVDQTIPTISEELRERASLKPTFNILFVSDNDSRLSLFRGSTIFKTFEEFYSRQANISCSYVPSTKLASMKLTDFDDYNILWIDNVSSYGAAKNLSTLNIELLNSIDPEWKETVDKLGVNSDETVKYIKDLNSKREAKLRIIYALDELVWEGPVGRSHDVQSVQIIETFINMADSVVVPTAELRELIKYYKFVSDENKDIFVIPTSVNADMYPLFKDFSREKGSPNKFDKPRVLVKGLTIPMNVQKFIAENHKKMKITVCTVGELDEHIMGLIQRQKVTHIYHWANPYVNRRNILATYALERDMAFDFVIHTKPDNLNGQMYELSSGDDDVLMSIASGSLPICGIDHVGYDDESTHLGYASGLTFGKNSTEKTIKEMIENYSVGVRWNDAFNKCRALVESRIITSPKIISAYFSVMLGRDLSNARNVLAMEAKAKLEQNIEVQ
jgi:hypothetical protein